MYFIGPTDIAGAERRESTSLENLLFLKAHLFYSAISAGFNKMHSLLTTSLPWIVIDKYICIPLQTFSGSEDAMVTCINIIFLPILRHHASITRVKREYSARKSFCSIPPAKFYNFN